MGNIVLLDELTINKIAAGEVIERPASVVKELMENAIDAGATKITVEVKNGGIGQIKVVDDGSGMGQDDLEIALEKHATSKIRNAKDLEQVRTMGFRGEALASIAAISHVEIISKRREDGVGNMIEVEAGKIIDKGEIGCSNGTTITITNLFFNTPVRYKFLRKDFTELGYIEDVVTRIALANPEIAIKLINEGKDCIQSMGNNDMKNIIYNIYGKDVAEGLLNVDYTYEDVRITGVLGKPEIARGNRAYQMFFVNNRYIKDKTLSSAAEQAFKGLLQVGKYGFLVLNLEIDPAKIDVNVHPTKLEIRFQEEQNVFKAVYHGIKESLLKGDLIKDVKFEEEEKKSEPIEDMKIGETIKIEIPKAEKIEAEKMENTTKIPSFISMFRKKKQDEDEEVEEGEEEEPNNIEEIFNKKKNNEEQIAEEVKTEEQIEEQIENQEEESEKKEGKFEVPSEEKIDQATELLNMKPEESDKKAGILGKPGQFTEMYEETFGKIINATKEKKYKNVEDLDNNALEQAKNVSVFEDEEIYSEKPLYKYIGAVFSTYILIEIDNEIYIIDQHAAHERILYEEVKENFYSDSKKDSQIMLLPDIISLSHKEKEIVNENVELFKKAGFIFEEFGDNTIRLIGVPTLCVELETKELFKEILDEINTVAITATQEKEDKFISTIACKAAVKANMKITKEEVEALMQKLLKLPNPFTCPHGRPTAIRMNKIDIEKKFGRK